MKTVQIQIQYHGEDERAFTGTLEMTEDSLRAFTRHLSSTRVGDVEEGAVVAVKNLLDECTEICYKINGESRR